MSTQIQPLRRELLVVTGASTGIGAATARELAARSFHILAGVRRSVDADTLRASNHQSAGNRYSGHTERGNNWLRTALESADRTQERR